MTNDLPIESIKPNENRWRMEIKDKSAPTPGPSQPKIGKDLKKNTEK